MDPPTIPVPMEVRTITPEVGARLGPLLRDRARNKGMEWY